MLRFLACFLVFMLGLQAGAAPPPPDCSNPRAAVDSLFAWLQPDSYDPRRAATCLDLPEELRDQGPDLAVRIKRLYDARGLYVPVARLPTDPDAVDDEGLHRVVLVSSLPEIYVEKVGDRWLYSRDSLQALPRLEEETFSELGAWIARSAPAWMQRTFLGIAPWQLLVLAGLVLVGAGLGMAINLFIRARLLGWLARTGGQIPPEVFERTRRPLRWLVGALVVWSGMPDAQLPIRWSQGLRILLQVVVSLAGVWIALRWIDVVASIFEDRARRTETRMDDQLVPLAERAAKVVAVALGLLFVLDNLGVDVGSLVAGLGIGGLAVALAAKDTLANLFGSLTIFLDRPFQVGDWVVLADGVEGTVEEVGFRSTRIRTFYDSVVTLPNATVAGGRIDNLGVRRRRRVKTTLGVTYDTPPALLQDFVEGLRAIVLSHPMVSGTCEIHFRDFGASSLEILVYFFLEAPDWHTELAERAAIFRAFLELAERMGVDFAFPTTSVHLERTPEHPLPPRPGPGAQPVDEALAALGVQRGAAASAVPTERGE